MLFLPRRRPNTCSHRISFRSRVLRGGRNTGLLENCRRLNKGRCISPDTIRRRIAFIRSPLSPLSKRARNSSTFQIRQGLVLPFFEISPNSQRDIGERTSTAGKRVLARVFTWSRIRVHMCNCHRTHTHIRTHKHAHSYTSGCPARAGLPSSFKGLTDDRHGTERRRVRIHHIFYVPTVGLHTPFPVHWHDQAHKLSASPFRAVPTLSHRIHLPENYFWNCG